VDDVDELAGDVGSRTHVLSLEPGRLELTYRAGVCTGTPQPAASTGDLLVATRPSRYAESDRLTGVAATEFGGLRGLPLAEAVRDWVHQRLVYVTGTSRPTDGAVETLLAGAGVCRDYAHLVVALLRALDVPARIASAYAPGLSPMDFHAVAEAWVDGRWVLLDATGLAPRSHMVRIATGRDAADTAWLTTARGQMQLVRLEVGVVALPSMQAEAPGVVELP
jgi:transglutaminase-like putative cysteine protease